MSPPPFSLTTSVDYLYKEATPNDRAVYKVHPYVNAYTSLSTINNRITKVDYFIKVNTVNILYDVDATAVTTSSGTSSSSSASRGGTTQIPAGCPVTLTDTSSGGSASTTTVVPSGTFTGDIESTDIRIVINPSSQANAASEASKAVLDEIKSRVDSLSDIIRARDSSTTNVFTNSHSNFNDYMYEINTAIGSYYFKEVYKFIAENLGNATPAGSTETPAERMKRLDADKIRMTAIANLRMVMIPWRFEPLMRRLREGAKKSLFNLMTVKSNFDANTFILAFANRAAMENTTLIPQTTFSTRDIYTEFRKLMYDYFNLTKEITSEDDPKIRLFMRKLLVDIFIKTCYPIIHFDLLDALMKRFINRGDFVNARMALISKCVLTYYMLNGAYELAQTQGLGPSYKSVISDIPSNIVNYIEANNRGNVRLDDNQTVDQRLSSIIKDLQSLSSEVNDNSFKMQLLQKTIADNQLTMRNVSLAIEQKRGAVTGKNVEFWILCTILIILILTCAILFFFDLVNIGIMIAAGTMVLILVFKLIQMIISYVNKN